MGSGERFDSISRIVGSTLSRRKALKLALGGAAGIAGSGAVIAFQQGTAGAVCLPGCDPTTQQCCNTNVPPASAFCAPLLSSCCGNSACLPGQQCCTTAVPNFCAPPPPVFCCGRFACTPAAAQCCTTGSEPHCEPAGFLCCGNTSCPPGQTCQGYPAPGICV